MDWKQWTSVAFVNRSQLPMTAGIYVVADQNDFVWYVGKATNVQSHWQGRTHHRYPQLIRTHKKLAHRIYWHPFLAAELDEKERFYIQKLRPELNGCKVKTYLPKQPQVEREIRRLLKVLNKPTMLFPVIRSVVAGEYVNEKAARCILIVVFINDAALLGKSMQKRYSAEARRAWVFSDYLCGRSLDSYAPIQMCAYEVGGECFEFVIGCDLLRYLEDSPEVASRVVGKAKLCGVEVAALRCLDVLDQVVLKQEFSAISNGKKKRTSAAYLSYRKKQLVPLPTLALEADEA